MSHNPITEADARARQLVALTVAYQLPEEEDWLLHATTHLERGHIDWALVQGCMGGVELWRSRHGFRRRHS